MKKLLLTFVFAMGVVLLVAPAQADWDPGDDHKMHFPQLPDPNGWDVSFVNGPLGDDWMCSETGPVDDVHLWLSFRDGYTVTPHTYITGSMSIWDDVPAGADPNPAITYSHPGTMLWSMDFNTNMQEVKLRHAGQGIQGWLQPPDIYIPNDHLDYYQLNIDPINSVLEPFIQEQGKIYWLVMELWASDLEGPPVVLDMGWKTSTEQFNDAAVYTHEVWTVNPWGRLVDQNDQPLDLAFVITPEPSTLALLTLGTLAVLRRR